MVLEYRVDKYKRSLSYIPLIPDPSPARGEGSPDRSIFGMRDIYGYRLAGADPLSPWERVRVRGGRRSD